MVGNEGGAREKPGNQLVDYIFNPFYTRHMASKYTHVTRTFGETSMLQK